MKILTTPHDYHHAPIQTLNLTLVVELFLSSHRSPLVAQLLLAVCTVT